MLKSPLPQLLEFLGEYTEELINLGISCLDIDLAHRKITFFDDENNRINHNDFAEPSGRLQSNLNLKTSEGRGGEQPPKESSNNSEL